MSPAQHIGNLGSTFIFLIMMVQVASGQYDTAMAELNAVYNAQEEYRHVRIVNDNDFWRARGSTDRYYTNGMRVAYVSSDIDWLERVFFNMNSTDYVSFFEIGVTQEIYTPQDITQAAIQTGDRPYAGWLAFSVGRRAFSYRRAAALTFRYDLGIIGPGSQADHVQTWFHELINSDIPQGWQHQIRNDIGLNFFMKYEKRFARPVEYLDLIYLFEANLLSAVSNNFGVGTTMRVGFFNDYFSNPTAKRPGRKVRQLLPPGATLVNDRRVQVYGQITALGKAVLDNSLLSGGYFSWRQSPQVIDPDDIQHFLFEAEFKLVLSYLNVWLEYAQWLRTREFNGALNSQWGRLGITVSFY